MVPGTGWHAGVRQPELGSDRGNDRLRTVPAGHRQAVGTALDRARTSSSRSSPASIRSARSRAPRLLGEREAFCLPATGARVVEQDRVVAAPLRSADPRERR